MKTIKDLGALVKTKYPGEYDDLSDEEVGRLVKKKHPIDYSDFLEVSTNVPALLEYYDPKIGRLRSWWRAYKSEGRGKLQVNLTTELSSILSQGAMLQDAAISSRQKAVEFESFVAQNEHYLLELQAHAYLLDRAAAQGMTLETSQAVKIAETDSYLRIQEQTSKTSDQIRLERELTNIKLHDYKEREAIKFNQELERMREQVRLALIAKAPSSHQRVMLVQELLDGLYKQIEEVENSGLSQRTIERMVEDREEIISHFKGYRNAEGNRLLQTD